MRHGAHGRSRSPIRWGVWLLLAASTAIGGEDAGTGAAPPRPPRPSRPPSVAPADLNRAINEVIQRREYTWRFPREQIAKDPNAEKGLLESFIEEVGRTIRRWARPVKQALKNLYDWLDEFLRRRQQSGRSHEGQGVEWQWWVKVLGGILVAVTVSVVGILLWRSWRQRGQPVQLAQAVPAAPVPDLHDEGVQADQLPPDQWQILANEYLSKGELRLALRALYLSTLAFLAQREWIAIAKYKTNREYESELQRRAASRGSLVEAFGCNVSLFEAAWYGMHEVRRETVDQFALNHQTIRSSSEK